MCCFMFLHYAEKHKSHKLSHRFSYISTTITTSILCISDHDIPPTVKISSPNLFI